MRRQFGAPIEPLAYSVTAAARALDVSPESIRRAIARGELEASRLGRRVIISRAALEAVLARTRGAA